MTTAPGAAVSDLRVRKAADDLLAQAAATGARPSVLALARRVGLSNTTFRRRYPEIAREIAQARTAPTGSPAASGQPSAFDRLVARNAKLKRTNRLLADQLKLAAAHLQRLAVENARLRELAEDRAGATRIDAHRT
jgi:hypothetical protein